ncbi:hypothetical protein DXA57_13840 [Blautia sp. OF03-15BH]|nr:hypothetical protein DXA57_13840 [Blautia sp. OF03-15BH]
MKKRIYMKKLYWLCLILSYKRNVSILCRKFEKSIKSFLDSLESVVYFLKNQGFGKARGNPLQRRAARSREPAALLCTPHNGPA